MNRRAGSGPLGDGVVTVVAQVQEALLQGLGQQHATHRHRQAVGVFAPAFGQRQDHGLAARPLDAEHDRVPSRPNRDSPFWVALSR